jgi:hypothetical protein
MVHNLTPVTDTVTDLDDSILRIFNVVKKVYISDPQISSLLCRIIKHNFKNSPSGRGWCYIHNLLLGIFVIGCLSL